MRRTKTRTLKTDDFGELVVTVFEVRPLDLLKIHQTIQADKLSLGEYERLLPLCCNLTKEQLSRMYPGEFAEVLEDFKEVNRDFLAPWPTIKKVSERVGLVDWLVDLLTQSGLLEKMKTAISLDLQKLSVGLPSEVTGSQSDTGGGTSESPSISPGESSKKKEKRLH
jgi:hypothetical protein